MPVRELQLCLARCTVGLLEQTLPRESGAPVFNQRRCLGREDLRYRCNPWQPSVEPAFLMAGEREWGRDGGQGQCGGSLARIGKAASPPPPPPPPWVPPVPPLAQERREVSVSPPAAHAAG